MNEFFLAFIVIPIGGSLLALAIYEWMIRRK